MPADENHGDCGGQAGRAATAGGQSSGDIANAGRQAGSWCGAAAVEGATGRADATARRPIRGSEHKLIGPGEEALGDACHSGHRELTLP
jgi:hypothetical protein